MSSSVAGSEPDDDTQEAYRDILIMLDRNPKTGRLRAKELYREILISLGRDPLTGKKVG